MQAPSIPKSLPELKKRLGVWFLKTFPTLDHLYRQQVLDGDAMILHLAASTRICTLPRMLLNI